MAEAPDAHVVIIGQEKAQGYGGPAPEGKTWVEVAFEGVTEKIDPTRLHMLGKVPHTRMLAALRASTAHVYYTYPFVLSWSLAEAMASGCYVIGSDTAPLHDAITDGVNGKLLPFFDVDALSDALIEACRTPHAFAHLRKAARETAIERFDRDRGRQDWLDLLREFGVAIPD
jgi:glycosyltransferase involved in cell wall biosynthesis